MLNRHVKHSDCPGCRDRSECQSGKSSRQTARAAFACLLACDALFEHGFIAVDRGCPVLTSDAINATPNVEQCVKDQLAGRINTW